ncbi:DegT/DnrJ/EryC1/StrS family aminotransferase [Qaidamihabitans albus]|uniref:DegT/DnrJ/EryC1/StrS family aminotransferase n=1 Tax=Qaidamihabitans albus TaxID=2795733 RepID=UPI001B355FE7|nr:DegT/DnrJ/EryC1/StrS family aminotransferase [Qaidamihabitans albus]
MLGKEHTYVGECLASGYVSSVGSFTKRFEDQLAGMTGSRHAVGCSSGTAALHVSLRLAGAEPGRLVAVSDFTFIASANAVSYTGADLLLVDSEPQTWNMNSELLFDHVVENARLGRRIPDIVEVVHVLGHPAFMEPLIELRDRFGIKLVEDAAEALGAKWTSKAGDRIDVGSTGTAGCFSFNGNKIVTSGSGGMIVTDDEFFAERARHLINQAKSPSGGYEHDTIGYNYRLTNLHAALGLAQLERLDAIVRSKWEIARHYEKMLGGLAMSMAPRANWAAPTYWLYSVLLPAGCKELDEVVRGMASSGVETRRLWPPLHTQPPYARTPRLGGDVSEEIYAHGISLPSSVDLTEDHQGVVVAALERVIV